MGTDLQQPPMGGPFEVDAERPLAGAGGGLDAYEAIDRRHPGEKLMAVRVPDNEAPRAQPLSALAKAAAPFCLGPRGYGPARDEQGRVAQFVLCAAPPGPSLALHAAGERWSEQELLETLLRPAASALAALQARRVTHRAIRPDNVFQLARGQPVTLGCAWASAPGSRQPPAYEPVYQAICPPCGRDDGAIADDVYALGVLMVALAGGVAPLEGLDSAAVVDRKLALGEAAAIIGQARLPPKIADLARGMLAEDPDHRPSPYLLTDPEAARTRRVTARPRPRGRRPIEVGGQTAWDARSLSHALAAAAEQAVGLLRAGTVHQWVRRELGDAPLALSLEEAVRRRAMETVQDGPDADGLLLTRVVAMLDPLAPPCWRGRRFWPEALGATLAAASPEEEAVLARAIDAEAFACWAAARPDRADPMRVQVDAREWRGILLQSGWAGGIARLRYASAPLLACRSAALGGAFVVRSSGVLAALEQQATRPDRAAMPMDSELAAFVAARTESRLDHEFAAMGREAMPGPDLALLQLRVLARLQARPSAPLTPRLADWLAELCAPLLERTRSRTRQGAARAALTQQAATGRLLSVLSVLDSPDALEADRQAADAAEAAMARLDHEIETVRRRLALVRALAARTGRHIVASLGLIAVAAALMTLVL